MKRFNLVLITKDKDLRPAALHALSKAFKSNFVMELPSIEEAASILGKLHIDMLIVDLDLGGMDLAALGRRYPDIWLLGVAAQPTRVQAVLDPTRQAVLEKQDFKTALAAELKLRRKELESPERTHSRMPQQQPAEADDFRDFFQLSKASLS